MKRLTALAAALLLMLSVSGASAGSGPEIPAAEAAPYGHLTVANPTPMRGDFFTDQWGNATSDCDVRDLLHGCDLVFWDSEAGKYAFDPSVVSGAVMTRSGDGDHTYVIVLCDDLYYSDGSRITAWDYAFSFLLSVAPEIAEAGGRPLRKEHLLGFRDYIDGRAPLAGVRVIADDTLAITLDHDYLPFFYELGLLKCVPCPIGVIAPGAAVRDDGDGVYIANEDPTVSGPVFTGKLLRETILDPATGYRSHPSVVSGPYTLTSFDGVTAEFEVNPYYKGDREGKKPLIRTLTYTLAQNDTWLDQLAGGEVGLINKAVRADRIGDAMERLEEEGLAFSVYPRRGLSFIGFAAERPGVGSKAVRQAIACCFDRDQVTLDHTGHFGRRVDGYYGIGQWMFGITEGSIPPPVAPPADENDEAAQRAYEDALKAYEQLSLDGLDPYKIDTARAARLLDEDGWRLNTDGLREKDGTVLDLTLIYPEGSGIGETLRADLADHLASVGIRLALKAVPMADLLTQWYRQGERNADMIYLASDFDAVFDPSVHFDPEGGWSYTDVKDRQLYEAAAAMRQTEPGDILTYMRRWIDFQIRFNEVLPMIPVYSNYYFDIFTDDLRDYHITQNVTWGQAVVGAYLADEGP